MTRLGSPWLDNIWPATVGFLAALAHVAGGGGVLALVVGPLLGWVAWQGGRWVERA